MDAIRIRVSKQMDGYTFSIGPSIRDAIKSLIPEAYPASSIFVGYDVRTDFENYLGKLENYIYPALLGVDDENQLSKLGKIEFIDTQTGVIIYKIPPRVKEI